MTPLAGGYLFLLGLASGITLLAMTSYRRISPTWLKWLVMATGLFVFSRYVTLALFTWPDAPQRFSALRHCWLATSVGLTLPSVVAVDQLIRHPAMTPKKLLRWFSPFLAAYAAVILFGRFTAVPDPVAGWTLDLAPGWERLVAVVQSVFVAGFLCIAGMLARKIPVTQIRVALGGLMLAQAYLGLDGILLAMGRWYMRPFLFSEMAALLAIWYALETAHTLQQSS